jgi:hypothetical protein
MLGDARQNVGEPSLRIMSFILAVTIRLYMIAARSPPRSEPQNNHDFLPRAMPRTARSAALLDRQTHVDLLLRNPVKLPFLNIELPLLAFFGLAPLLFIIAHVYTLVHLVMLAAKVGRFDQEICRQFTALLHHITIDLLKRSYLSLERDSAPGIDGVTWQTYGENLEEKLARPIRESAVFWSD